VAAARPTVVPPEWRQFNNANDQEFGVALREFRGDDTTNFKKSLRGGEGQVFGSDLHPDRALKRWFTERQGDMARSVELLRAAEAAVAADPEISALIHVVKIHDVGPDWILRDFVRDSTQIRALKNDAEVMRIYQQVLALRLHEHPNEILHLIGPKVKRFGSNIHWSPSLKKLVIIDMQ
jgi:hypothetical protein